MTQYAPPPPEDPRDHSNLELVKTLHYVWAGLSLLGACLMGGMSAFLAVMMPKMMQDIAARTPPGATGPQGPPVEIFEKFGMLYGAMGVVYFLGGMTMAILSFVAARKIAARRGRTFCIVVSAINCLAVPLGTALGVVTIMILSRESVARVFDVGDARDAR